MIVLSNAITRKVIWKHWDRAVWSKLSLWCISQRPSHWLIILNTEVTLAETKSYMSTTLPSTVRFIL